MSKENVQLISNDNGELRIGIKDRIDTNNVTAIEKEIEKIIENQTFNTLIIDFSDLNYISSVGIRTLVKLSKAYNDVRVENATLEVLEVLSMTGIDTIIPITRKLREFSTDNLEKIGAGFNGAVYKLDNETILKVINTLNTLDDIQRERDSAQKAFLLGIPSAISFDVVKADDYYGIIYELLDTKSFDKLLIDNPDRIYELGKQFGKLGREVSFKHIDDEDFIDKKEELITKLEDHKEFYDEESYQKIKELFESIPDRDNFVHGDLHPGNALLENGKPLLIDFSYSGKGHPIFDLLSFSNSIVGPSLDQPDDAVSPFNSLTSKQNFELWDAFLEGYMNFSDVNEVKWLESQLIPFIRSKLSTSLAPRLKVGLSSNLPKENGSKSRSNTFDYDMLKQSFDYQLAKLNEALDNLDDNFFEEFDEFYRKGDA